MKHTIVARRICAMMLCILIGSSGVALSVPITVSNGNTTIAVNPQSAFGLFSWDVSGVNQMFEEWFWFRQGSATFETSLHNLTLLRADSVGSQIHLAYDGHLFRVDVLYELRGGPIGNGVSRIDEMIILTNTSDAILPLVWFAETDLDLNGTGMGDFAIGGIPSVTQTEGSTLVAVRGVPPPDRFQIAPFPLLFRSLTDNSVTNLDNTGSPFGPGDVSFAFQWNLTIPIAESVTLTLNKQLVVPEPGTHLLFAAALLGILLARPKLKGRLR
jgi:hypothetical protein